MCRTHMPHNLVSWHNTVWSQGSVSRARLASTRAHYTSYPPNKTSRALRPATQPTTQQGHKPSQASVVLPVIVLYGTADLPLLCICFPQ